MTQIATPQGDSHKRAPRYLPNADLMVRSKTIGTMLSYQLSTDDISYSGLLLSWDHNSSIPFRENTLLEMEIDTHGSFLSKPMRFMGKVARRFSNDDDSQTKFGISIVQMDQDSLKDWEECLNKLEEMNLRKPSFVQHAA